MKTLRSVLWFCTKLALLGVTVSALVHAVFYLFVGPDTAIASIVANGAVMAAALWLLERAARLEVIVIIENGAIRKTYGLVNAYQMPADLRDVYKTGR